jgi:flagellar protein FlgJ
LSIKPPSDIVLDVARAADPARSQAAMAKLMRLSAALGTAEASFDDLLGDAESASAADPLPAASLGIGDVRAQLAGLKTGTGGKITGLSQAHQALEAFVLQSFVGTMLPKSEKIFGKGTAGDIWRSMMAEHIAGKMAKAGGIGLTRVLGAAAGDRAAAPTAAGGVDTSRVTARAPAEV